MSIDVSLKAPPLQEVSTEWSKQSRVSLKLLRLDLMHPQLGGNKWFKLKLNLLAAKSQGYQTLLSFGGAYSNHLRALAVAGNMFGFNTVGVVRGELVKPLNPVLSFAQEQGMKLLPLDRERYRRKHCKAFLRELTAELKPSFGEAYVIPEGGSNRLGVQGCKEIAQYVNLDSSSQPNIVALACGTGTTLAGLVLGMESHAYTHAQVLGISTLKAPGYITNEVNSAIEINGDTAVNAVTRPSWDVRDEFHCGGYAKTNSGLEQFLECWQHNCPVPIEPVYTGKLLWGLKQLCESGEIISGSEIIAIHSGGVH